MADYALVFGIQFQTFLREIIKQRLIVVGAGSIDTDKQSFLKSRADGIIAAGWN